MLIIKSRRRQKIGLNEPLKHVAHKRPVTRRDFLAQGFITGAATIVAPTALGMLMNPRAAAALTAELPDIALDICEITNGAGKIPFICFDLAGGANIAGSNVLVGKTGGQLDFLTTQGYSKLGLPGNMLPNNATTNFVNTELGLAFHSDSAFLRGILERTTPATRANVNGVVIPARSENDTGNNPHNPMYGIAKAGAKGSLLTLIGSQNSDSGGNSMAPAMMVAEAPENRPTKIDRAADAAGLAPSGGPQILSNPDTVKVMEAMARISQAKLGVRPTVNDPLPAQQPVTTGLSNDEDVKERVRCAYVKTADTTEKFADPATLNPRADTSIRGGIFTAAEFDGDREFEKTASVMKLVIPGYAGAGTISMGGYDYHTGDRSTGELRDLRAGRCIGAVLEYARIQGKPVMVYVFSDGSLSSNGRVDSSVDGRGKGEWTGDNQQTAAAFILVYNPAGRPALMQAGRNQLGAFSAEGDVVTSSSPGANNVNLLVQMVLLNYMALHNEAGQFTAKFGTALGTGTGLDQWIGFAPIA
ncbi:MAG TPA: hypothetical protein VJS42_18250 [Steroidobacteraceae bacterium]|nr:hypothetical protein [Steroidobacteraceae bacterium]